MALLDLGRTPGRQRSGRSSAVLDIDLVLVGAVLALSAIGVLMVFSATRGAEPPYTYSYLLRQGLFCLVGVGAMFGVAVFDYRKLQDWAWVPYLAAVVGLLAVLSPLGSTIMGAQRWFSVGPFTVQPSEFLKLGLIILLASLLATWGGEVTPGRLAQVLGIAAVPMVLVMAQPDLGTVLQYLAMALGMVVVGGVRGRYLLVLFAVGLALAALVLTSDSLASYQRDRLTGFIDPAVDTAGITYNQNQSVTAVASGGALGFGLFEGPQTQLRFVPEQETDFIFTVVSEELGFLGGAGLLALYGLLCWRIWRAAQDASDPFGMLLCSGVLIMLVFQAFANIGMALGIMPVTGTALPFISYGGSGAVTMLVAVGLVLSVELRRFR